MSDHETAVNSQIAHLFVYGTLKRGECRESMWPRKPIKVLRGFVRARLYSLGAYPAIRVDATGDDEMDLDWVAGEVWVFERGELEPTIKRLDEIEETNQPGVCNLYDHVLVRAYESPGSGRSLLALAYQYSCDDRLDHSRRLRPREGEASVAWTASSDAS